MSSSQPLLDVARSSETSASTPPKDDKSTIVLITLLGLFVDYGTLSAIIPIAPLCLKNIPQTYIFVLFSSKSIAQILFNPVAGHFVDKHHTNIPKVFTVGMLLLAVSTLVFGVGLIDSGVLSDWGLYYFMLAARSAQGLGSSSVLTAGMAAISNTHEEEERGGAMGVAMVGIALGVLLGPPVAGGLASLLGPATVFWLFAAIAFLDVYLMSALLRKNPKAYDPIDPEALAREKDDALEPFPFTTPRLILGLTTVIANMTVAISEPMVPLFLNNVFGYGEGKVGLVFGIQALAYLLGTPVFGYLSDVVCKSTLIIFGLAMQAGGMFMLFSGGEELWVICVALGLLGVGISAVDTPSMPLLTFLVPPKFFGRALAQGDICVNLGYLFGPLICAAFVADDSDSERFEGLADLNGLACAAMLPLMFLCVFLYERKELASRKEDLGGGGGVEDLEGGGDERRLLTPHKM
ncbi:hypothetical protein TrVE_jg3779 [Triparma verrucosa]|uniref:Major facilitator superfamily (MFS) profile domain-containing protein n=1 Tax=Triparma verrucosa TaxID=1606542 RepID=A0A9W7FM84_9STRA|nr:hypothetical protein TrVE_jg3779 [Triparma verrucosa]